jgi:hypothetical protein
MQPNMGVVTIKSAGWKSSKGDQACRKQDFPSQNVPRKSESTGSTLEGSSDNEFWKTGNQLGPG